MPKPLTVWITINWKILKEMGIPHYLTCLDNDEAVERHDQHSEHCHNRDNDFLGVHFEIDFLLLGICWIMEKAREFQKNTYFCFIDYAKTFDCVDHNKLWKILKEMGIPDHLTCS